MKTKCKHENIDRGYGFLPKFRGIGVYSYCEDCNQHLTWLDDKCCNNEDEIEYNKKLCEEKGIKYE